MDEGERDKNTTMLENSCLGDCPLDGEEANRNFDNHDQQGHRLGTIEATRDSVSVSNDRRDEENSDLEVLEAGTGDNDWQSVSESSYDDGIEDHLKRREEEMKEPEVRGVVKGCIHYDRLCQIVAPCW